ncbi:MAG: PRC-barrel domain-containing protein [Burkholderiales bacterium]
MKRSLAAVLYVLAAVPGVVPAQAPGAMPVPGAGAAPAQVVGTTTLSVSIVDVSEIALGWSAKRSILGKWVINDAGEKVGQVDDLIITSERNLSFLIVGAGGFIGMGRHDVAIPISQFTQRGLQFVLPGASKAALAQMPQFDYASDTTRRDRFVARADADIAKAKEEIAAHQRRADTAGGDAKARLDLGLIGLREDLRITEVRLAGLRLASANRWREFELGVSSAIVRLRGALDRMAG